VSTDVEDAPELPNVSVPRRWLASVELSISAQDALDRGGPVDTMVSVMLADAASEALLGHLAGIGGDALPEHWDKLLSQAVSNVRAQDVTWPPGLGAALTSCHKARNAAVHNGVQPSVSDADDGIRAGRRLMAVLPLADPAIRALPDGAGFLGAVAEAVSGAPELAQALRDAEMHLGSGRVIEAADAGAMALNRALYRTVPPVWPSVYPRPRITVEREFRDLLEPIGAQLSFLQSWVVPLALGVKPVDYERMVETLGEWVDYGGGRWEARRPHEPSEREVRRALEALALIVARMAQSGALFVGELREAMSRTHHGRFPRW